MGIARSKIIINEPDFNYYGEIKHINKTSWVLEGNGRFEWEENTYIGEFKNNCAEGKGTCTYNDGSIYTGDWSANFRHGIGKMIFNDGSEYEGMYKFDIIDGHGKYRYYSGCYYIGNITSNKLCGKGKLYTADNVLVYSGNFIDNNYQGHGIYYFPNGKIEYIGYWKQSLYHGHGILYDENHNIIYNGYFHYGEQYSQIKKNNKTKLNIKTKLINNLFIKPKQLNNQITLLPKISIPNKTKTVFNPINVTRTDIPGVINPLLLTF
jgi:hypothetical protein